MFRKFNLIFFGILSKIFSHATKMRFPLILPNCSLRREDKERDERYLAQSTDCGHFPDRIRIGIGKGRVAFPVVLNLVDFSQTFTLFFQSFQVNISLVCCCRTQKTEGHLLWITWKRLRTLPCLQNGRKRNWTKYYRSCLVKWCKQPWKTWQIWTILWEAALKR